MRHTKDQQMRQRLAVEAARILAEGGHHDYQLAKKKAASHLGAPDTRNLPGNAEIEQALKEHHRLFNAEAQSNKLIELRKAAIEAMNMFQEFQPRLVGVVLSGTAGEHAKVELHLFSDPSERVSFFLIDRKIPYQEKDKRLKNYKDEQILYPAYQFLAGDIPINLVVFPLDGLRQAPLSSIDGKPVKRADIDEVKALIESRSLEDSPFSKI